MSTHTPTVYFVQAEPPDGPVKIGYTKRRVDVRVAEGQTFSSSKIHVIVDVPGTRRDEARLHRRFAHLHLRGEWFTYGEEIRDLTYYLADGGTLSSWLGPE